MLREIMTKLRKSLKQAFPEAKVYEEFVKQGFLRPCFFSQIMGVEVQRKIGNRYLFTVDWQITYYPKALGSGDINALYRDLNDVALTLYEVLGLEGYFVEEMHHKIEDKILVFSLRHSFYAKSEDKGKVSDKMLELNLEME